MLQFRNRPSLPVVRAYDPTADVLNFAQLLDGALTPFSGEVAILSPGVAGSLGVAVGDEIDLLTPNVQGSIEEELAASEDEPVRLRTLQVIAIAETHYGKIDGDTVFLPLSLMQDLFGVSEGVPGIALKLSDRDLAMTRATELNEVLGPHYRAITWLEDNQDLLFVFRFEKTMVMLLIVVISVVAAFSIVITLLTTVISKTREIGIYRALGGVPMQIALIFSFQGFLIGMIGTALGLSSAMVYLHYRIEIMRFLYRLGVPIDYTLLNLPSSHTIGELIVFAMIAVCLSTAAGLLPSIRAARLKPATALRTL